MYLPIISLTLLSFAITYFVTPKVIEFANKLGLVDNPKVRSHPAHIHQGIIPRAGGLGLLLGIIIPSLLVFPLNRLLFGIIVSTSLLVAIGLWDDKKDRSPYIRLFTNALAALIMIMVGINIPYITNPFGGILHLDTIPLLSYLTAFIWILWTTNIIGWSGGVDGQLPGFVAISALVIGLLSLRFAALDPKQIQVTYLSFITGGAFLGFLPWNVYPQKIMPGYGGKTLAGFMLAVLSILTFSKLGTALLVLIIPMTDAVFMLLKRIFSKKSPVLATNDHLHHHLLTLGWSKKKVAVFYWLISLITGLIALSLNAKQKIFAMAVIIVVILGFIILVDYMRKLSQISQEE